MNSRTIRTDSLVQPTPIETMCFTKVVDKLALASNEVHVLKKLSGNPFVPRIYLPQTNPQTIQMEYIPLMPKFGLRLLARMLPFFLDQFQSSSVLNRDFRPEHFRMRENGEICIVDWGLAIAINKKTVIFSSPFVGSLQFAAHQILTLAGIDTCHYCVETDFGTCVRAIFAGRFPGAMEEIYKLAKLSKNPRVGPRLYNRYAEGIINAWYELETANPSHKHNAVWRMILYLSRTDARACIKLIKKLYPNYDHVELAVAGLDDEAMEGSGKTVTRDEDEDPWEITVEDEWG